MSCADANYGRYDESSPCGDFNGLENYKQQVGGYPPNGYGLHDMAGNVREWVNDWYSADYYRGRPEPDVDPPGPEEWEQDYQTPVLCDHVLRGGSWISVSPLLLRVSFRGGDSSGLSSHDFGFRCAADQDRASED